LETGALCRPQAPLAGDQPITTVTHASDDDGLDNSMLAHTARELLNRRVIEGFARLVRIRIDLPDRDLRQAVA